MFGNHLLKIVKTTDKIRVAAFFVNAIHHSAVSNDIAVCVPAFSLY